MKRKSPLILIVLAVMVLFASSISSTANSGRGETPAVNCAATCWNNYQACKSSCGGDPLCLDECREQFDCCRIICHGLDC